MKLQKIQELLRMVPSPENYQIDCQHDTFYIASNAIVSDEDDELLQTLGWIKEEKNIYFIYV